MSIANYLIVHTEHLLHVGGVNSGAEMATLSLAKYLARSGRRVVVCGRLDTEDCERDGVTFWDLGASYDVAGGLARARALGTYHLISSGRAAPLLLSTRETGCLSRSLISHDRSANDSGLSLTVLSRIVDHVFCVSDAQRRIFNVSDEFSAKFEVIHNGVDLELFAAGDPARRNYRRLVFAGALVEDKGVHVLLGAYARLKGKYHDLTLDIYGSADLWGRRSNFDERDLERRLPGMRFHGKVPQSTIADAFRNAALCVIPSIWFDPFPLVSLDAQAAGCPVVAFDVGGLREGIIDGATGVVVRDVSEDALTQALDALLAEPARLVEMSRAAAAQRSRFTWEKLVAKITSRCEQAPRMPRVGVVSSWNQECGLATYAGYLFRQFPTESIVVFGEEGEKLTAADEPYVERCWRRGNADFKRLHDAVLRQRIEILYLNCHARFLPQPAFGEFVRELQQRGIKVVAHLHSTFTIDPQLQQLVRVADRTIVHSREARLEAIANGAEPSRVSVLPHGVAIRGSVEEAFGTDQRLTAAADLRRALRMPLDTKVIVAFGFVQPHKGMEGVIDAVAHLNRRGIAAVGYIAGRPEANDPHALQYLALLKQHARELGVEQSIVFVERFLSDSEVGDYLAAADLVLMNYKSQHYEASGACALAVGAGALVATSVAPTFNPFADAVWHLSAGYPASLAAELLFTNPALRETVENNAERYRRENSWPRIAARLRSDLTQLVADVTRVESSTPAPTQASAPQTVVRELRVLMQNRGNALRQRGGDTIVMERLKSGLEARGVQVTMDLEAKEDPTKYDLVHLFNFALPDLLRALGQSAQQSKVPFVVTTLYEDIPNFHNQSITLAQQLIEYTRRGQDRAWYERTKVDLRTVPVCAPFDNTWVAENAALLFTNGLSESQTIRRDYPKAGPIREVRLGCEVGETGDAETFFQEYGERDFILCVGRIESRKNQLMLLKALEDSPLTVVLASGGFTYQPEYDRAVRGFKRKGRTLILDRISPKMLASAYCAARVHALPSWYELPGLVTLEAACHGCNVVASNTGTTHDYLGDKAFYCDPASETSIMNAVLTAYYSPQTSGLREVAMKHTWDSVADETLAAYQRVVKADTDTGTVSGQSTERVHDMAVDVTQFQELLERGELAAKERRYREADELLRAAERINPLSARLLKAMGAMALAEGDLARARERFEKAVAINSADHKLYTGLAMVEMREGKTELGYRYLLRSLELAPYELVAILQLLECAYALGRFEDLRRVLEGYLTVKPDDLEMRYCLAGCIFKQGEIVPAERIVDQVLAKNAAHVGAQELKQRISEQRVLSLATAAVTSYPPATTPQAPARIPAILSGPISATAAPAVAPAAVSSANDLRPLAGDIAAARPLHGLDLLHARIPAPSSAVAAPTAMPPPAEAASMNPLVERRTTVITEHPLVQPLPPSAPTVAETAAAFDAVDMEILEIEEAKRQKKYEDVKAGCERLLQQGLRRADQLEQIIVLQAEMAAIEGRIPEAEQIYGDVLARNPRCARALCGQGAIAANGGDWSTAQSRFETALSLRPEYDVALAGLGLCSLWRRDSEGAWHYFSRAQQANPENGRALLGLIELGYGLKRLQDVEQALKAYLEMHPLDLQFVYALAGCYYAQSKLDEATEALNTIVMFEPQNTRALELQNMIAERRAGASAATAAMAAGAR